jgi:tetratricopeptide (TPR) repeat protein
MKPFVLAVLLLLCWLPLPVLSKTKPPSQFAPNPLDSKVADPLLPDRPLTTAAERERFSQSLDALNLQAAGQLAAGDPLGAFDIWNRELRLRRALGEIAEVTALGRVGETAWQINNAPQVRWITQRLNAIAAPLQASTVAPPESPARRADLMQALAVAYQQVRSPKPAIALYQKLLADPTAQTPAAQTALLNQLGQLHVAWFSYPEAAEIYQQLLSRAVGAPTQILYLTQLVYIYEQANQPAQAIPYLQQLIALYPAQSSANPSIPDPVPGLSLKLGDSYTRLGKLDQAEATYQTAYKMAQVQQQMGFASAALDKLGTLYRQNDRLDAALRTYDFLVGVEFQSYNYYGMMSAYDQLGQIHLIRKAYPQAIAAFQNGLELAKRLKHREDYFSAQITAVSQQQNHP